MYRKAVILIFSVLVAVAAAICLSSCLNKLAEGETSGTGQNTEQNGQQPDDGNQNEQPDDGQGQEEQPSHSHSLLYVPYRAADCVSAGNREYWVCTVCGNYYADAVGNDQLFAQEVEIAAKGHTYVANVVAPACEERGYTEYVCSDCGDSYTDPLSYTQPAGHKFSEWQMATPSTCLAEGEEVRTCSACGRVESKALPLGSHSYGEWHVTTPASCVSDGEEARSCSVCGNVQTRVISQLTHNYAQTIVASTCTAQGYTLHKCTLCGDEYRDEYTSVVPHDYAVHPVVRPTCVDSGTDIYTCTACGDSYTVTVAATGHNYGEWHVTTPATCIVEGEQIKKCGNCGNAVSQTIPKTAHSYAVTVVDADCESGGYTSHKCKVCGDSYNTDFTDPLRHDYISTVFAPTCTEQGYTMHKCSRCDSEYKDSYTPVAEHDYISEVAEEPTCTHEGLMRLECSACGDEKYEAIAKLPHTYSQTIVSPKCEEGGYTLHTCEVCGHNYKTDPADPLGHDYISTVFAPTCTEQGYTMHECSRCDNEYVDSYTPVVPHSYTVQTVAKPTCTQPGEDKYTCTECGYSYTVAVEATGHSYGEWQLKASATCTEDGELIKVCASCSDTVSKTIPKTGHSYTDVVIPPDCENGGYTLHKCGVCGYEYDTDFTDPLGHAWELAEEGTLENGAPYKKYVCSRCHDEMVEEGEPPAATEGLQFELTAQGWYAVIGLETEEEGVALIIPSEYNGLPVREIADGAFSNDLSIISALLPQGITYIGERAFYGCNSLATLSIPYTVETIGEQAFAYCGAIESIWYDAVNVPINSLNTFISAGVEANGIIFTVGPHVQVIPAYLLYADTAPKVVEVVCEQGSVLSVVGSAAFYRCTHLSRAELPPSLTQISAEAFYGCSALSYVSYPASASVSKNAFKNVNANCEYNIYQVLENILYATRRREKCAD